MMSPANLVVECVLMVLIQSSVASATVDIPLLNSVREERNSEVELATSSGDYQLDASDCPPWFLPSYSTLRDSTPHCYCADTLKNIVQCNSKNSTSFIALNYCMTYDNTTSTVLVGACPYAFVPKNIEGIWVPLPSNVSQINKLLCSEYLNRKGLLCGECMEGYGISVHSSDLSCVKCSDHPHGWAWFFFTEILLQTLFFLIVFFFRINITTAKLNGFLLVCQIVSSTYIDRTLPLYLTANGYSAVGKIATVVVVFSRFWVLEFFTIVLPRACFRGGIDMLKAVALGYVSAFYPFFLILCTFIFVKLTDCNYKPVSVLLKPYKKLHVRLSKYIDFQRSLIHAFSGIIVLSYSKLAFVSYSLLFPTTIYNTSGAIVYRSRWYHDAEIELFGSQHLPYGIIAIVILLSFVVAPPLLLVLYPFKCFRWFLHKVRLDYPGLDAFMDCFQGCYKDGTDENGRDLRYFAALYFVLRLLFISTRLFTVYFLQWDIIFLIFVSATILFAFSRPYKKNIYNIIDVCFLSLLSVEFFLYAVFRSFSQNAAVGRLPVALAILIILLSIIPLVYFVALVVTQLVVSVKAIKRVRKWSCDFLRQHLLRKKRRDNEFPLSEWPQRLLEDSGSGCVRSYGDTNTTKTY